MEDEKNTFLSSFSEARKARARAWLEHKCVDCGEPVSEDSFHDALSEKEYTISAMCQKCQDAFFGPCDGP